MVAVTQPVAKKRRRKPKCLVCKTRSAQTRGDCTRCIGLVWDRINSGEFSEQEAIARGLLLQAGKPGRPRKKRRARKVSQ